jgi:O-antigen ligase
MWKVFLNISTRLLAPLRQAHPGASARIRLTAALRVRPSAGAWLRAGVAGAAFVATLAVASLNEHAPLDIQPGQLGQSLAAAMPLVAAFVAAYAILRPWPAFLVVLLLTPFWDLAQVSWLVGPVSGLGMIQVIMQTVFVLALALGIALRRSIAVGSDASLASDSAVAEVSSEPSAGSGADAVASGALPPAVARPHAVARVRSAVFSGHRIGWVATAALLVLASLSTWRSPDLESSMTVLMHGIFEPVAMGVLLIVLARSRRRILLVLVALGLSVALGGALNMIQSIPAFGTLAALQTNRLLFSRLTYFNVGLFGEMLAMAAPLILGAIAARRQLGLGRTALALLTVALIVSCAALFLTFSKSAYLATAGGAVTFLLLLATTWRRRVSVVLVSLALSAFVVPWPALLLQVSPTLETAYRTTMVKLVGASRYYSWDPAKLSGRGSVVERLLATEAAVHMAADHPILGIGLDQFKTEYVGGYKTSQAHLSLDSAHTFWPEVAAELGIPALGLVVLIFAAAMLVLWRIYRAPPDQATRLLALTLLASLVAWLLVATAFAGDMYRPWRNMSSDFVMMAVLVAAAFALSRGVLAQRKLAPAEAETAHR